MENINIIVIKEDFLPKNLNKYKNLQYHRSMAALSADGNTLILATADDPLSAQWSAELMMELGGSRGMLLDSGGSATIYLEGQVLNDAGEIRNAVKVEKSVINALGILKNYK